MGQSLVQNYIHIVFGTKARKAMILPDIEPELFAYITTICKSLDSPVVAIGAYVDHIHILCRLHKSRSLVEIMTKVKAHSSRWIKKKGRNFKSFQWQEGYGAFSVDYRNVDKVIHYINNQHIHHGGLEYEDEMRNLLKDNGLDYDERYLFS